MTYDCVLSHAAAVWDLWLDEPAVHGDARGHSLFSLAIYEKSAVVVKRLYDFDPVQLKAQRNF